MGQCQTVIKHLRNHGSLTQLEATKRYNILRLSERIREIKDKGVKIKKTYHKAQSAEDYPGCVGRFVRYYYEGEE